MSDLDHLYGQALLEHSHFELAVSSLSRELTKYAEDRLGVVRANLEEELRGYAGQIQRWLSEQQGTPLSWNESTTERLELTLSATHVAAFRLFVSWVAAGRVPSSFRVGSALADPAVRLLSGPASDDEEPGAHSRIFGTVPLAVFVPGAPRFLASAPLEIGVSVDMTFGSLTELQAEINELATALNLWIPAASIADESFDPLHRLDGARRRADSELAMVACALESLAIGTLDAARLGCPLIIACGVNVIQRWSEITDGLPVQVELLHEEDELEASSRPVYSSAPPGPSVETRVGPLMETLVDVVQGDFSNDQRRAAEFIVAYIEEVWQELSNQKGVTLSWRETVNTDEEWRGLSITGPADAFSCFGAFLGWIATGRGPGSFLLAAALALPEVMAIGVSGKDFPQCFATNRSALVVYAPSVPEILTTIPLKLERPLDVTFGSTRELLVELERAREALALKPGLPAGAEIPGYNPYLGVSSAAPGAERERAMLEGVYYQLLRQATRAEELGWPLLMMLRDAPVSR